MNHHFLQSCDCSAVGGSTKKTVARDYAAGGSMIRRGGSVQRASTCGGHFLFFISLQKQASSAYSNKKIPLTRDALCDPEGIQTPNLLIRSQMLYSVKLRDLFASDPQSSAIWRTVRLLDLGGAKIK
jgi:hypothetical protein